jgi:diguanylate cyclase (GGDEF)-like protein
MRGNSEFSLSPISILRGARTTQSRSPSAGVTRINHWDKLPTRLLSGLTNSQGDHAVAFQDALTQLLNREAFQELLERCLQTEETLGLLMVDLDRFKDINDTFGHSEGDEVLRRVGRALIEAASPMEIVTRVGGDEFAIILPGIGRASELKSAMVRYQDAVSHEARSIGRALPVSASVGGALYPLHCTSRSELMQFSEIALHEAKMHGRGESEIFRQSSLKAVHYRHAMLARASQCLEKPDSLRVYYQPKIDLRRGKLVGYEGLLRCIDQNSRIRGPSWISAAFDHPTLSIAIGDKVRKECFKFAKWLLDQGEESCRVALNVTAFELRSPQWAQGFLREAAQAGVPTTALELEVTESVVLGDKPNVTLGGLHLLHDSGVTITLDDFGTGFASLSNLRNCPIDSLKIDRSFTKNLMTVEAAAIIKAIIGLGKSLGLVVVAEGIENSQQHRLLTDWGCDHGQGFLYGHAIPTGQGSKDCMLRHSIPAMCA